jgi:hypothetical protein
MKASMDTSSAVPILRDQLFAILNRFCTAPATLAFLYLSWRTASRFDEIEALQPDSFLEVNQTRITIWWRHRSKSSQLNPHQPRFFVVLSPSIHNDDHHWNTVVQYVLQFPGWPAQTRHQARSFLKRINPMFTDHSVKTGAINHLLNFAANNVIPLKLISLVAKHKMDDTEISETTIGYGKANYLALARALKTEEATKLL